MCTCILLVFIHPGGLSSEWLVEFFEQEKAIHQVLGSDRRTTHLIPNWQDLDVMESLDKVLSFLAEFRVISNYIITKTSPSSSHTNDVYSVLLSKKFFYDI